MHLHTIVTFLLEFYVKQKDFVHLISWRKLSKLVVLLLFLQFGHVLCKLNMTWKGFATKKARAGFFILLLYSLLNLVSVSLSYFCSWYIRKWYLVLTLKQLISQRDFWCHISHIALHCFCLQLSTKQNISHISCTTVGATVSQIDGLQPCLCPPAGCTSDEATLSPVHPAFSGHCNRMRCVTQRFVSCPQSPLLLNTVPYRTSGELTSETWITAVGQKYRFGCCRRNCWAEREFC